MFGIGVVVISTHTCVIKARSLKNEGQMLTKGGGKFKKLPF
jgi:hypothetical protein